MRPSKQLVFGWIGYTPYPEQAPIHDYEGRILGISGGEGGGKSLITAAELAASYPFELAYIIGPEFDACRKELGYLYNFLERWGLTNKNLLSSPQAGKQVIKTITGARIETLSTKEGEKEITGTGESPDVIAFVEAGKQTYSVFKAALRRIERRANKWNPEKKISSGRFIMSGTPEESLDWYPDVIAMWEGANVFGAKSYILPAWANKESYPGGENDPVILRAKATMTPEEFGMKYGGKAFKPPELVIPEFDYTRHVSTQARLDLSRPIWLAIDPGYSGSHYSVLVIQQPDPSTVWVVDEIYATNAIHEQIIEVAKQRDWWWKAQYGVIDIAGARHQGASKPATEIWGAKGNDKSLAFRFVSPEDGVNLHRQFLRTNRVLVHPKCTGMLGEYRKWKRHKIGEVFAEPRKDNCDAMKAFHYFLMYYFGALAKANETRVRREEPNPYAAILAG